MKKNFLSFIIIFTFIFANISFAYATVNIEDSSSSTGTDSSEASDSTSSEVGTVNSVVPNHQAETFDFSTSVNGNSTSTISEVDTEYGKEQ